MAQDEQTLDLLGILHYVYGGLVMAWSLFAGLFYGGFGFLILHGNMPSAPPPDPALDLIGWFPVLIGTLVIVLGWTFGILNLVAGGKLRKHVGRTFCYVISVIGCLDFSLGAVLGIFTIITLQRESVVQLFSNSKPAAAE